jgi:putative hydrolase of the HAD superfamily
MKTFVFDADGVICVGGSFTESLDREYHIPRIRLAAFFAGPFPKCILGVSDLKEEIEAFLPMWGWRGSTEEFLMFWFQREHVLNSDALTCVRALRRKGHLCVLGTNQEKYRAAYLTKQMGLAEEFDHILPSCELGAVKPSQEFFVRVQAYLQQPPSNLCLIDDAEGNVGGALAAGWSSVHYRSLADIARIQEMAKQEEKD